MITDLQTSKTHRATIQIFVDLFSFDMQDAPPVLEMKLRDLQVKFREMNGKTDKVEQFLRELTPAPLKFSQMFRPIMCLLFGVHTYVKKSFPP